MKMKKRPDEGRFFYIVISGFRIVIVHVLPLHTKVSSKQPEW